MIFERHHDSFVVSTDRDRLDVEAVLAFLVHESAWARWMTREVLERAIEHSLCFGVYTENGRQIGFARVISDFATYAYLNDVYILAEYQWQGLGEWLLNCVLEHPNLQGLKRFSLTTIDKQNFYNRFGFKPLHFPERHMEKLPLDYYSSLE